MTSKKADKPEQVLVLDPASELTFKGPFKDIVTSVLSLSNPTERKVAFKVKTTAPRQYCVRPNNGVIGPNGSVDVSVMLQPLDTVQTDKNKHKFMVLTMFVDDDGADLDALWKAGTGMMDSKLKCVFVMPQGSAEREDPVKVAAPAAKETVKQELESVSQSASITPAFSTPKPTVSNIFKSDTGPAPPDSAVSVAAKSEKPIEKKPNETTSSPVVAKKQNSDEDIRRLKADILALKLENDKLKEEGLRQRRSSPVKAASEAVPANQELMKQEGITTTQLLIAVLLALMWGYILAKFII